MQDKNLKIYNISLKLSVVATALWSGVLAVMLSSIIDNYALTGTRNGLMSSMISIGALISLLTTILYQGRFRKTQIIIVGGFLASVMLIIQGIPMAFALFLLSCFVMGFGHGAVDSFQSAFLADLNRGNTVKHMGSLHGIYGVGSILTPIILHELLKSFPWRTIYVLAGFVCFLLIAQFAVVTRFMKNKISIAGRLESKLTIDGIKEFFENKLSFTLLLCIFFGAAAQSGIIVWTIRYISISLSSPEIAAVCLSIFWVTSTISRFVSPLLPFKPSQIVAFGAFTAAIFWTAALIINSPLAMCVSSGIAGLFSGSCIPMMLSEGAAIKPERTGFSTSLLMISKTIAQILSPIIVAFVMSLGSMRTGMFLTSILFIINGTFALMLFRKRQIHLITK